MKKILIGLVLIISIFTNIAWAAPTKYEIEMDDSHGFYRALGTISNGAPFYVPFKDVENKTLSISKNDTIMWKNSVDLRITIISEQDLWDNTTALLAWSYKSFSYTFPKNGTYKFYIKEYPYFQQIINVGTESGLTLNLTKSNPMSKLNSTKKSNLSKPKLTRALLGPLAWSDMEIVKGTWIQGNDERATDYDKIFVTQAGYIQNFDSHANLDEFKLPNLTLNAGTYEIKVVTGKYNRAGILEVLSGSTSIGKFDCYNYSGMYNVVATFIYSPTVRTVADLRFRVNGKNASSGGYDMLFQSIQIRISNNSNTIPSKSGNGPNNMQEAGAFVVLTGLIVTTIYGLRKNR